MGEEIVREIEIGGEKFTARGLRLSEVSAAKMRKLGYGRFLFVPEITPGADDQQERMGEIMDAALSAVFGKEGIERIDRAGGVKGLHDAFRAIIAETYGTPGEEKNSSSAGSGSTTPGGPNTAEPAAASSGSHPAALASTEPPPG
ncbi:MAG: hypothetical protein MUC57_00100 [Desulfobacterales bacterium]|nr:hypothetical protein [Desulfobacterales bacterium]